MTKFDLGTLVSAVSAFLVGLLITLRDVMGRGLRAVRGSFVALISSPAVWLAVGVTFVGGFWVGHIQGGSGKRALRSEVVTLDTKAAAAATEATIAQRRAQVAVEAEKAAQARVEALEAEVAALQSRLSGRSSPVSAISRRPASREPKPETASSKPFWPFN